MHYAPAEPMEELGGASKKRSPSLGLIVGYIAIVGLVFLLGVSLARLLDKSKPNTSNASISAQKIEPRGPAPASVRP